MSPGQVAMINVFCTNVTDLTESNHFVSSDAALMDRFIPCNQPIRAMGAEKEDIVQVACFKVGMENSNSSMPSTDVVGERSLTKSFLHTRTSSENPNPLELD